jgi:putative transcriptional regulator
MSIKHHPSEGLLSDFAGGRLDDGMALAVATHIEHCPVCRRMVRALEHAAGDALEATAPVPMSPSAQERIARMWDQPSASNTAAKPRTSEPWLPAAARQYGRAGWKWVAPGVSMQPILLPKSSKTRAFLLKSAKGTSMLQHTHSGIEMTCVLTGSFSHEGGVFEPGDFDFGDDMIDHQPVVGSDADCVCLVAMTGDLQLKGLLGRLMQPFIRL